MIYIRYTVDDWVTYSDTYSYNMSLQSCSSSSSCTADYKVDWRWNAFDWQLGKAYYLGVDGNIYDANVEFSATCQLPYSTRQWINTITVGHCFRSWSPIAGVPLYIPCQVNSAKCWCAMELQQDWRVVTAQDCYSRLYHCDTL